MNADIVVVSVESITLAAEKSTLTLGGTTSTAITTTVNPATANVAYDIEYTSSNTNLLTVTKDATDKKKATVAIKEGASVTEPVEVTITATVTGTTISSTCKITVNKGASVNNDTGIWTFSSRTEAPAGANAWDASTALSSDVVLAADSGTGTFTVLSGVKAKYNSGLQFSASKTKTATNSVSSLKKNFKINGVGTAVFKLKVVTACADYTANDGQKTGIGTSADAEVLDGSVAGTEYTKSFAINGETDFYIGNLKILSVKIE